MSSYHVCTQNRFTLASDIPQKVKVLKLKLGWCFWCGLFDVLDGVFGVLVGVKPTLVSVSLS